MKTVGNSSMRRAVKWILVASVVSIIVISLLVRNFRRNHDVPIENDNSITDAFGQQIHFTTGPICLVRNLE